MEFKKYISLFNIVILLGPMVSGFLVFRIDLACWLACPLASLQPFGATCCIFWRTSASFSKLLVHFGPLFVSFGHLLFSFH